MLLNNKILEEITEGSSLGSFSWDCFSIDSRTIEKSQVFIALVGGKHDGHNFIENLISKDVSGIIINENFYQNNKDLFLNYTKVLIVKNTYDALVCIAKYKRSLFKGKMIGITGSVGKTTLKEMLVFLCQHSYKVAYSVGNFNNHIGLPLCLANISLNATIGIFEMGMSSPKEISFLSHILKPDIAIITEIASAHQEFFSSLEEIANAKAEIFDGMPNSSSVFLNQDSEFFNHLQNLAIKKGINYKNIHSVALDNKLSNIYLEKNNISYNNLEDYGCQVEASVIDEKVIYRLKTIAKHNVLLSLFALGICKVLDISLYDTCKALQNFSLPKGRGHMKQVFIKEKAFLIIDDAYKASPVSMISSIDSLQYIQNNSAWRHARIRR